MHALLRALRHPRLALRLQLIVIVSLLALIVLSGLAVTDRYDLMWGTRAEKLRSLTDQAVSIAAELDRQVQAGTLKRDEAVERFRSIIRPIRFDGGVGYYFVYAFDGNTVVLGPTPALEGTNRFAVTDADGKLWVQEQVRAAQAGGGTVIYRYPKPGTTVALPKLTYVQAFAPWGLYVGTGEYIDDLQTAMLAGAIKLAGIISTLLLLVIVVAWLTARSITKPLGRLRRSMTLLAEGDLSHDISGTERHDEVGEMAATVLVFKEHMLAEQRLLESQRAEQDKATATKRTALVDMADTVESQMDTVLQQIGGRTQAMAAVADAMHDSAGRTDASARDAASAAAQALANVQTVASAAEQLAASIREIGGQVNQSNAVVGRAVTAGQETRAAIEALNGEVAHIGNVVDMIDEIAARTNLLALNATIEAARAGEAGKGFAVVASEVKQLATQTTKSTAEIGRHIDHIRAATTVSVEAVRRIEETISEINAIAGGIAAAVEQQGAATAEIARNVSGTAEAANAMTARTNDVSAEAAETGHRANDVHDHTVALETAIGELRRMIIRAVRTATPEIDRRASPRYETDLPCQIVIGNAQHGANIKDLSDAGARIIGAPPQPIGTSGSLKIDGVGFALPFAVIGSDGEALRLNFVLTEAAKSAFRGVPEQLTRRRAA